MVCLSVIIVMLQNYMLMICNKRYCNKQGRYLCQTLYILMKLRNDWIKKSKNPNFFFSHKGVVTRSRFTVSPEITKNNHAKQWKILIFRLRTTSSSGQWCFRERKHTKSTYYFLLSDWRELLGCNARRENPNTAWCLLDFKVTALRIQKGHIG